MTNSIILPKDISDHSGIKDLLEGQFKQAVGDIACVECGGPQSRGNEDCPSCNGHGIVRITQDIEMKTIISIYAAIVDKFGIELP